MRYALAVIMGMALPIAVYASGPTYGSIQEIRGSEFTLKVQKLGEESRMFCSTATLNCATVDPMFILSTTTPTSSLQDSVYNILPDGASWLTLSQDDRFVAYYVPTTAKRPTRTFGIVDTTNNHTYTNQEKNNVYWDLLSDGIRMFAFSPDSTKLLYLSDKNGAQTLYQIDLTTLQGKKFVSKRIISRQYTIMDFGFIDDSTIYFTANRENAYTWNLYSYRLGMRAPTQLGTQLSYNAPIKRVGDSLLFIKIEGNTALPQMYNVHTHTLSSFTLQGIQIEPAPNVEIIKSAGLTGAYWPADMATTTLVVWLHGGPYRQTATGYHSYFSYAGYDWMLSELVASGVPVLRLDYPGSLGYGRNFAESLRLHVGVKDVADSSRAISLFAKAHGFKNVYLVGNSYGGYLAAKLLVEKPSQFKGALPIAGVWDWNWLTDELQTSIFNVQFGGLVSDKNQKIYDAASIVDHFDRLGTQKIIIAHGDSDTDIPYIQSKAAYDMLRYLGLNATLLTFNNEDHIFVKKDSLITLCQNLLLLVGESFTNHCAL